MKNLTFLALLLIVLSFSNNSNAQVKIALGLEAGINIANTTETPAQNTNSKIGLIGGGNVDIGLSPTISIVPGLRYVMKGNSLTGSFPFEGVTYTEISNKGNYLQFPALLKVKFPLTEIKPYLIAGPMLGILLSATQSATAPNTSRDFDIKTNFESTEFSLLFGGGMDFRVATKTDLFIQFAYELGLSNISKIANNTVKTNGIQITGGVKFGM